jgi:hypothetical protein
MTGRIHHHAHHRAAAATKGCTAGVALFTGECVRGRLTEAGFARTARCGTT